MTARWEVSGPPETRFSRIELVEETGSTNKDLLEAARTGAPEGRVLITNHQTAGRGRQGRQWIEQPETSLLMSVLLRPDSDWAPLIPLATGLAVVATVSQHTSAVVGLKWPNDVLVRMPDGEPPGERKLVGILAEAITVDSELVVVVGWGMNLRPSVGLPADIAAKAIDLESIADRRVAMVGNEGRLDRVDLARSILIELDRLLDLLEAGQRDMVLDHYRRICVSIGRQLELATPSGPVSGLATGIDTTGGIMVDIGTEILTLTSGEAHHI